MTETISALREEYPEVYEQGLPCSGTQVGINEIKGALGTGSNSAASPKLSSNVTKGLRELRNHLQTLTKASPAQGEKGLQALNALQAYLQQNPSQNLRETLAYLNSLDARIKAGKLTESQISTKEKSELAVNRESGLSSLDEEEFKLYRNE